MTQPDQALLARLNADVATISSYLARVSGDLHELNRIAAYRQQAVPTPATVPTTTAAPPTAAVSVPPQPATAVGQWTPLAPPVPGPVAAAPAAAAPVAARSDGWIGKGLAIAGVAVTLVGVVLLVVLAAQAGILHPPIRVGLGGLLAAALVGGAFWLVRKPGGRVGATALAATGIATAYLDVLAITTIYEWVPPVVGLVFAAAVAGGGLALARWWNSEQLALLVLIPLLALGPAVVGGVTLLLVGFMLALSAATLPAQLGKDWLAMHGARMAVSTLPLLIALVAVDPSDGRVYLLAAACGIAALLAVSSGLLLSPHSTRPTAIALFSAAGTLPVLVASLAVPRVTAAVMAVLLAGVLFALALLRGRLPGSTRGAAAVWAATAAVALLIAITVAFDGPVAGPVLLAVALVVAITGRGHAVARWAAIGFGVIGGLYYLAYAPPSNLFDGTAVNASSAVSTLIASLLVIACSVAIAWAWVGRAPANRDVATFLWASAALIATYAVTMFTVTAGVLLGGVESGFYTGHVVATICWIALAAAVFRYAAKVSRTERSLPIVAGVSLVAAAMAKLFLFDLGTLGGIFRVIVFIVVGLALLGMGAGYARLLAQQDEKEQVSERG